MHHRTHLNSAERNPIWVSKDGDNDAAAEYIKSLQVIFAPLQVGHNMSEWLFTIQTNKKTSSELNVGMEAGLLADQLDDEMHFMEDLTKKLLGEHAGQPKVHKNGAVYRQTGS